MSQFRRRFNRDEFTRELRDHLASKPEDLTDEQLDAQVQKKAEHYEEAINRLDKVKSMLTRLRDEADQSKDRGNKEQLDLSIREIDEAISAYGVASLSFNARWQQAE